ncbi:hypothetical protein JIX56_00125 [Streptomyces sp. CA-210063]|uniref:hypothetical protein n=1 Tax=Streptomyces sp. CA-210063 TaxID=2801029 RepID=UPI00214BB9D4|nr:hypothetical protein [Streptomyces sp. CA-210063]UUU28458.1 hypothetical protein JIX56_00125 [Streptomyces sp. CA-210063]
MTIDGLRAQLTAEHFRHGRVPRRTTAAERLAGVNLTEDFVQAVADVCSRDATERERWLKEASALMAGQGVLRPGPGTDPLSPHPAEPNGRAELVEELVQVQRQTLDVHDRLLRAWERAADLERERGNANRMVVVLLTMVDKLHRDTASLTAERDRLRRHERRPDLLEKVRERLARSEIQRKKAEAELERARSERNRADRLAEQAAQQVRALTEELERLRHQNGQTDNSPFETILTPRSTSRESADADADDIDEALAKAARHLDDGAERLERLAQDLHADNLPDNPATGMLTVPLQPEPSEASTPDTKDGKTAEQLTQEVLQMFRKVRQIPASFQMMATEDSEIFLGSLRVLLQSDDDYEMAFDLLDVAGEHGTADHVAALTAGLRRMAGASYAFQLLSTAGRTRSPHDIVTMADTLRAAAQEADAYQLLSAVGRERPAQTIAPVVEALNSVDAGWVLETVHRDRSEHEVTLIADALSKDGFDEYLFRLLPDPWSSRRRTAADLHYTQDTLVLRLPQAE